MGIVTHAYDSHGIRARFTGRTAHTGPTPMEARQNALIAAARWLVAVDDLGWAEAAQDGKATAASLRAWPNRAGILSDFAEAVCDVRHPDPAAARVMRETMRRSLHAAAAHAGCTATIEDEWSWGGAIFDADLTELCRRHAAPYRWRDIASQAGHDAYHLSAHCPTAMIFTPCRNGITHNHEESCDPDDLAPGLAVLLNAVVERAVVA
ncbi:N-carbamoyl-L-amino-acid hydrolase [Palleronia aestuarii]|uniref:N-carbamoyl-L-amino-acid hydrolase n=1 Tax=Palleronia aestuarii TaxID=568105 RepID=A0A2W7NXM8_9RHOB|nr:N-carbamoyl-L-amino-acid hydrolase [Palleronia aestuarii]